MGEPRDPDVTRIIANAVSSRGWTGPGSGFPARWGPLRALAEQIVIALHEAGYTIARLPETKDEFPDSDVLMG